jgi:hypothetical protein
LARPNADRAPVSERRRRNHPFEALESLMVIPSAASARGFRQCLPARHHRYGKRQENITRRGKFRLRTLPHLLHRWLRGGRL